MAGAMEHAQNLLFSPKSHARRDWVSWLPFLFFAGILVLAMYAPGNLARYFTLLASAAVGAFLYFRNRPVYASFVWWLWFLTPFVRRVVNYRSGWVASDPILAAPLLGTVACAAALISNGPLWRARSSMPFKLAFLAVGYGFCIGIFFVPLNHDLIVAGLMWMLPIAFGFFLFTEYAKGQIAPHLTEAVETSFKWGLLLMGFYGVVQFVVVPPWDALWLIEGDDPDFGFAEPFAVRVFSTMSSPLPLGVALFAGLVLLARKKGFVPLLATVGGYSSLALCLVRSTWGLWAIGTILVVLREKKLMRRFLLLVAAASICIAFGMTFDPIYDVLHSRFISLTDLNNDVSFQGRTAGYQQMFDYVASTPIGLGLGSMDYMNFNSKTGLGNRDSGVLEIFVCLGWIAGILYFTAFAFVVWFSLQRWAVASSIEIAASAICIALIGQLPLAGISVGFSGLVFWSFAGIVAGSHLHGRLSKQKGNTRSAIAALAEAV